MSQDFRLWTARQRPERALLEGRYVRLEPLEPDKHGDDLFAVATASDAAARFRYLSEDVPADRASFDAWIRKAGASDDPLYFAVIEKATGRVEGRQTFMRMTPEHGVMEIGHIHWGSAIARTRVATEAHYLFMRHAFETLGYRRWEWKCNDANGPSKRAAVRFGFKPEGVFRQHMIVKGENRDTAWFSIVDSEWPALKQAYAAWLDPGNFDGDGRQARRLEDMRKQ